MLCSCLFDYRALFDSASVGMQMGRTKVFLRRRAFDSLELVRSRKINAAATTIQSASRMFLAKTWLEISIMAVLILQSFTRRLSALRQVRQMRRARSTIQIQCAWRGSMARRYFSAILLIVKWGQSVFRGRIAREVYAFLVLERKALIIQRTWRRHISFSQFNEARRLTMCLQCLVRGKLARLELKKLKCDARDLDLVTAERDRLRAESASLKRELENARRKGSASSSGHVNGGEPIRDSSSELERLRKEVERLKNERLSPPTCSFVIPSDASDNVEDLHSLASECAQKDRELQLLKQELATLRCGAPLDSNAEGLERRIDPDSELVSTMRPSKADSFKEESPAGKSVNSSPGILSPFKSLFGSVCRGKVNQNTPAGESPTRSDMPSSARSVTSTSLLDNEEDDFGVGDYGFNMDGSPMAKHMQNSSSLIEESWSPEKHAPVLFSGAKEGELCLEKELLLHRAASDGDENTLRDFLQKSPNAHIEINEGDFNGRTPLHLAVLSSNLSIASLLLENDAVANSQDHEGCTPLHLANNPTMTELLLEKGNANPNIPNLNGVCVLHLAVRRRDVESIRHILRYKPDINAADNINWFTPLHLIAQPEKSVIPGTIDSIIYAREQAKPTLRRIADMLCAASDPYEPDLHYQDREGNTPLHHAAMLATEDAGDLFSLFLEKGGDPNLANQRGQTVLHLLCHNDALRKINVIHEILHLVLFHGADPNRQSLTGCTALHLSLYHQDIDSAIQLINGGAELHLGWKKVIIFQSLRYLHLLVTFPRYNQLNPRHRCLAEHDQQPTNWAWVWDDMGTSEVLALDMVQDDEHSLHRILAAITRKPKWAPSRNSCMHCKLVLGSFAKSRHCRHCGRSVCGNCSHRSLGAELFPKSFGIQESSWVCIVCENILMSRQEENGSETQPNSSIQEDSDEERASL